ncbi:hypothetical protein [Rhodobacter ferrooxidans]|uniref:Uncharacterized protein n=1 Tax=Rhodobacter ferrooxidans TaxID=371731 RepID=C8RYC3_9RHOB|nr:hypothetical protein [Rhodobacter sp. SW2]EEW26111.1 hypothetical protein Rsw2DRAFT_0801 [Rhodobacter sp. SW2]
MLLLGKTDSEGVVTASKRIAGFGGTVELETEMYAALSALLEDPVNYGLFVMDCDAFGGIEAGMKAFAMLGMLRAQMPVILISKDCAVQTFPEDRSAPIQLRAPLSAVSLRVGFEHALRERRLWRAA